MNDWIKHAVVYQIYPRSFCDSNNDGIGDLVGIISKLDYLQTLGINTLWLSPVYASPNDDNGYDISDYRSIHPDFGTMADMEALLLEAKKRDIRILMDLVINHTSDEHPWFQASKDPHSPYRDYYYWRPGKAQGTKPPNNWTSFFAQEAWSREETSGEYYLHLFSQKMPDLNYHNPKVRQEVKDIMRFWLDKGVAGFRCDVINILYKRTLEDGKKKLILTGEEHYLDVPECHALLREFQEEVFAHYDCFTVGETVFTTSQSAKALIDASDKKLDMVFSFDHMAADHFMVKWFSTPYSPSKMINALDEWQREVPWNANYLENHDQPRSLSRFGAETTHREQSAKLLATMLFTQKGTPFVFQGQEIGMSNYPFSTLDDIKDIESHNTYRYARQLHFPKAVAAHLVKQKSRDHARTPMQWDTTMHAGFTQGKPWLRVNPNYLLVNVKTQQGQDDSILHYYQKLIALRKNDPVLIHGDYALVEKGAHHWIFDRTYEHTTYRVYLNLSDKKVAIHHATNGTMLLSTYGHASASKWLEPYEAIVEKRQ